MEVRGLRVLDAAAVTAWAAAITGSLDVLRPDIDGINVYPVADSDTGSNLLHTMLGARDALAEAGPVDVADALGRLAQGAVASARGNSGVIMSQVIRGFAEAAAQGGEFDGVRLASAFGHADKAATGAVTRPVAGTILTVLHTVAAAVRGETRSLEEVAVRAAAVASAALEETPNQLPVLARAGVVDAGARGLVAVLDALVGVITGTTAEPTHSLAALHAHAAPSAHAWEVMYLLDGVEESALPALRRALSGLGDSVTVAGDGAGSHAVHVHCADIGAAIEAGIDAGRPRKIRVEPLITPTPVEIGDVDRTVVAVVHGGALAEVLRAEGVAVLAVPSGSTPTVEEMLGLINEAAGTHVTVLPGGVDLTGAADAAAGLVLAGDRDVVVIPCASPVQVLAALAVHDPARRTNDDVVAMAEAAAATRRGELVISREESLTWVGRAQAGDMIGLIDDEVVLIEPAPASETNLVAAAMSLLNRMLGAGGELVTVLTGTSAPDGLGAELGEQVRLEHPEVELTGYSSGQADTVLLIGVE
jgi:DAK2 domain fusion protein YloV